MKQLSLMVGLLFAFLVLVVACESKPTDEAGKAGEGKEAAETKGEGMAAGEAREQPGGAETALMASPGSPGRMENDEGVGHYKQGHWDVAEVHFRKSVGVDPGLAEAHFNLALALDKLGKHGEATDHFKKAAELAPDNPQIAQSKILKAHTGM